MSDIIDVKATSIKPIENFGAVPKPKPIEDLKRGDDFRQQLFDHIMDLNKVEEDGVKRDRKYDEGAYFTKIPGIPRPIPTKKALGYILNAFNMALGPAEEIIKDLPPIKNKEGAEIYGHIDVGVKVLLLDAAQTRIVAEVRGSASTMETRHRYRTALPACPDCGENNIRPSKQNPGFYCWLNTGGCGSKFAQNDDRITEQDTGKVENENPYDQRPTVKVVAHKRAMAEILFITQMDHYFSSGEYITIYDAKENAKKGPGRKDKKNMNQSGNNQERQANGNGIFPELQQIFQKATDHFGDSKAANEWVRTITKGKKVETKEQVDLLWREFDKLTGA